MLFLSKKGITIFPVSQVHKLKDRSCTLLTTSTTNHWLILPTLCFFLNHLSFPTTTLLINPTVPKQNSYNSLLHVFQKSQFVWHLIHCYQNHVSSVGIALVKKLSNFWCRQNNVPIPRPNLKTLHYSFPYPYPSLSYLLKISHHPTSPPSTKARLSILLSFPEHNLTPHLATSLTTCSALSLPPSLWTSCPQGKYSETFP